METADNHYVYFQNLERSTKAGLIAYMFLLVLGLTIALTGADTLFRFMVNIKICESLFITLLTFNILQILVRGINKIHWLGDVHIWLDKTFFKFLYKSNEIILRELLTLLEPRERALVDSLAATERNAIARSIFSRLAEDQSIFESLLKRGIFRSWIWYWIMIYGVSVFALLTITSFSKSLIVPSIYSQALFTSIGIVAFLHLVLSFFFGYNLINVTKRITREITNLHHTEIVSILRTYVQKG